MRKNAFFFGLLLNLVLVVGAPCFGRSGSDYTQFGHDIRIGPEQNVGEVTCFNCSVYVRGNVGGDITTFHGSVVLEDNAAVGGEVTAFLGDLRADSGTKIGGDVTVFSGTVHRQQGAEIGGEVTTMDGAFWFFLIFIVPILFLIGIVALIVWLVQRNRRPAHVLPRAA
jgi:hypothetical protein